MPKGRRGSPRESIDSILLAMSRRKDIDEDTLSHYLDRLDEEWEVGARTKVLQLLRSSDSDAHSTALLILSELATEDDLEELEDVVADPTVGDLAKLSLVPILKELGSEMADDGIIEYLNDPEAAMLQMQLRLLDLVGQSELGVESILEDVLSMPTERRFGFINWLGMSQDPRAAKLLIPLLENQPTKVTSAVIEALEQLGPIAAQHSIPALNYLLANSSNRQLKQQARTALGRLTMQSPPGTEDEVMAAQFETPPLYESRVSFVDGAGAQMVMISWERPDGRLKGVNVLYQDDWGIKDCYGTDEMERNRWSELVEGMESQGFGSFVVPFDYCRSLIAEARALNKRTRHKVPVAYAIWRPFIEGTESNESNTYPTILEPLPVDAQAAQLAQRGDQLYHLKEFTSWFFDPFESIRPYVNHYISVKGLMDNASRGRKRKGSPKAENYKQELESFVSEVITNVVDNRARSLYETRLRRQAALFQLVERAKDVELIRAVAAVLHPASGIPAQDGRSDRTRPLWRPPRRLLWRRRRIVGVVGTRLIASTPAYSAHWRSWTR